MNRRHVIYFVILCSCFGSLMGATFYSEAVPDEASRTVAGASITELGPEDAHHSVRPNFHTLVSPSGNTIAYWDYEGRNMLIEEEGQYNLFVDHYLWCDDGQSMFFGGTSSGWVKVSIKFFFYYFVSTWTHGLHLFANYLRCWPQSGDCVNATIQPEQVPTSVFPPPYIVAQQYIIKTPLVGLCWKGAVAEATRCPSVPEP